MNKPLSLPLTAVRPRCWRTVEQIAADYPFTPPALRALIQRSRPHFNSRGEWMTGNGLADAITQIGGRHGKVLIDEIAFAAWLERGGKPSDSTASSPPCGAKLPAPATT